MRNFLRFAPSSEIQPALNVLLAVIMVFSMSRYFVEGFFLEITQHSFTQGWDLQVFYLAGQMLRTGENIYDADRAREIAAQHSSLIVKNVAIYQYPPLWAIVMVPLSYLPFPWVYRLWVGLQQVFLAAALFLLVKSYPTLGRWGGPIAVILAANMWPLYEAIDIGQVNILLLLLLALTIYFARTNQDVWAGAALAVAAMIKMSPFLLLGFFLLQRRWRVLAAAGVTSALLVAFSWAIAGTKTMLAFAVIDVRLATQLEWIHNLSLAALFHRLAPAVGLAVLERPAWLAAIGLCLATLSWLSWKKLATDSVEFTATLGLWITAMLVISPVTWGHHFPMLLPALLAAAAVLAQNWGSRSPWLAIGLGIIYTFLAFEHLVVTRIGQWWEFSGSYFHDYFFTDLRLLGLLGLFSLLAYVLARKRLAGAAAPQIASVAK